MDLKVFDHTDTSIAVRIEGGEPTFVNAIRRTLLADVPKMAIEDVEFHLGPIRAEDGKEYESVAPLFDEIISQRLGLVPIPTDLQPIGDPKLKPKDGQIPIVKLGNGQALLIYATATLGTGRDHAKWQVAHGVGTRFATVLKAGGKTFEAPESKVPPCPDHIMRPGSEEATIELRSDCRNCRKF